MKLLWTPEASANLDAAQDFIAQDNPAAAPRLVEAIHAAAQRIVRFPDIGAATEPLPLRVFQVARTPFRIYYLARHDDIVIVAVWHGARSWRSDPF